MNSNGDFQITGYQQAMQQLSNARPSLKSLWPELFKNSNLNANDDPKPKSLIEISGDTNTGKTMLLWQLVVRSLLPTYFGGKYVDVIYIDAGNKLNIKNFYNFIKCYLEQTKNEIDINSMSEYEEIAKKCLDSVTKLCCPGFEQLETILENVEDILWENNNVALLVIDKLDAFYWTDICRKNIRKTTHYARAVTKLHQFCCQNNICCAYTLDFSYLEKQYQPTTLLLNISNDIRYKFQLELNDDKIRTLNGRPTKLNGKKIEFI